MRDLFISEYIPKSSVRIITAARAGQREFRKGSRRHSERRIINFRITYSVQDHKIHNDVQRRNNDERASAVVMRRPVTTFVGIYDKATARSDPAPCHEPPPLR